MHDLPSRPEGPGWVKVRDIIKWVEAEGWRLVRVRGSHRRYEHPTKAGRITIAGHLSMELAPKTLASILKQANLRRH